MPQRRRTRKCAQTHPRRMWPVTFKAEYIWIDGTAPTAKLRSKTKIIPGAPEGLDALPGAWFVDEPSKPQMGSSAPLARILVFERSFAVGSVPSIQMYSAL